VKGEASVLKAKAWTFEAKVIGPEAKAFKGTLRRRIAYIFLVHLESIYYQIFFYSKIVPNCAVAK